MRKVSKEDLKELTEVEWRTETGGWFQITGACSLVRERALTTGLCSEGWYSEHSGVCRRTEQAGGSVKVKKF